MHLLRAALFCVLAVFPLSGAAQSRQQKIDDVLLRMSDPGMPMTEREVLPQVAEKTAQDVLAALGKRDNLGAGWKPGNPHWDRARALIVKDQASMSKRKGPQERQQEANSRELLEELSDADLDEVYQFYRSALHSKAMRSADATMVMIFRTIAATRSVKTEQEAERQLRDFEKALAEQKLSEEEQRRYDKAFDSPAMRTIRRGAGSQIISAMNDPGSLLGQQISPEAAREITRIVDEYRKTELAAAPSTPAAKLSVASGKDDLDRELFAAIKRIDMEAARAALDAGADIGAKDARPNEGETPLHHAARTGNVEVAKLLVARRANVNVSATGGFTPLHVAAGLNRRAMAEYLLSAGANPNAMDRIGTPLHAATLQGHAAMVGLLLEKGADANARSPSGVTPLQTMSSISTYYSTHTGVVRRLADSGADLYATSGSDRYRSTAFRDAVRQSEDAAVAILESKAKIDPTDPRAGDLLVVVAGDGYLRALTILEGKNVPLDASGAEGLTALHAAARANRREIVVYLLSRRISVDARDANGRTPLFGAAENGFADMVEYLLSRGATIDARDLNGNTPLHSAIYSWRTGDVARLLVGKGASLSNRNNEGLTPLDAAVVSYVEEPLSILLAAGADAKAADAKGITALHRIGRPAQAQLLLAKGANINAADRDGNPPLFPVIRRSGGVDVAKFLVARGADPKVVARDGSMLIHHAAVAVPAAVQFAMDEGAGGVNLATKDGRTPLHTAAQVGQRAVVEFLLKNGSDLKARTATGDTALHYAVSAERQWGAVEVLLKAGADARAGNASGDTPIDVAVRRGNQALVRVLETPPADLPALPPLSTDSLRTRDR